MPLMEIYTIPSLHSENVLGIRPIRYGYVDVGFSHLIQTGWKIVGLGVRVGDIQTFYLFRLSKEY